MTPLQRFRSYLSPYWPWLIIGVLCILVVNCAKLFAPLILGRAIDGLQAEVTEWRLIRYGVMLVLIALGQYLFLFLEQYVFIRVMRSYECEMRNDYYAHLQKLPVEFYQKYRTGDLMTRAVNDINVIRTQASAAIMFTINAIVVVLLMAPLMFYIEWRLALLTFSLSPLVAVATQGFSKRIHARAVKVQEYVGMVANRAQESLAGIRVTRAYAQEQAEIESFQRVGREAVAHNLELSRLTSIYIPTLQIIVQMVSLLVLCYGGVLIVERVISIGQFVQFMLYAALLVHPMIELGSVIGFYERAKASVARINEVMSIEPTARGRREEADRREISGEIEFRNLTLTYRGAQAPVLKQIDLRVAPGQMVALLGAVGAGKSTLISLVPRVLEAEAGSVLIDGRFIEDVPLEALRASIGYVPQESFLFSETVAENIAFGTEGATREEIERAAAESELAKDIEAFPQGYDTVIGERGITLSGGQRQRLAIARALIRRPRILLLDDALSSVDTYTEEKILTRLRRIRGCSSLIISHRVSTVRHADLIVILEEGRIVERGAHAELLTRGGPYAKLCERQALEEELVAS